MAQPRTQVALAVFGLLALASVALVVLPEGFGSLRAHQLPGGTTLPGLPAPAPGETTMDAAPIEANLGTGGQATAVRIYSPVDPRITLVQLSAGTAGTEVNVLGSPVLTSGATAPMLVEGDVRFDDVVTFNIPSTTGESHWVRVDRSTAPACIELSPSLAAALTPAGAPEGAPGQDLPVPVEAPGVPGAPATDMGTICAPVGWVGEATNPTDIVVFNPEVGDALAAGMLFRYHDNGDGTSSVSYRDPQSKQLTSPQRVRHEAVTMEGSPFEAAWTVRIQPEGQAPTTFNVPLDLLRAQMAAGNAPNVPYLEVLRDALYDTDAYKAITDGDRTYAQDELAGEQWLNGASPLTIFVDMPQAQLTGAPTVMLRAEGSTAPPQQLPTARGDTANGYVRHEAMVPQAWLNSVPDGSTLRFSVAYKITAAKVVSEQLVDDNHGAGYRVRMDRGMPTASNVRVEAADPAKPHQLTVTWQGRDTASGIASYKVEWAVDGAWQGKPLAEATDDLTVAFTGSPGKSYTFRVTPKDNVGLAGNAASSAAFPIPGADGGSGANDAPTIQLLQPTGSEQFLGVPSLTVKWRASDPDGTTPVINLYWSSDGGATWEPLASPRGSQYTWDITKVAAGEYRLKAEATDGSLGNQDTSGKFRIDNAALGDASAIGGGNQAALDGTPPAMGDGTSQPQGPAAVAVDATMVIVLALVLIACAGVVAVWRFKQR